MRRRAHRRAQEKTLKRISLDCPRKSVGPEYRYGVLGRVISRFGVGTISWILIGCTVVALLVAPKPWENSTLADVKDYVRVYSWWAGALNLVPLVLLALTTRWWTRPLPVAIRAQPAPKIPRGFLLCVGGAVIACALLGYPRLSQSLWEDEEYSVRRCIVGGHRVDDDGQVRPKHFPWRNTLWNYSYGTNHILQSVLARLSHSAWRWFAQPGGLRLSEAAIRLPSYLAGILIVPLLALLMARFGFPWEGAFAAWLVALHPWHLRFATEARGYGLVALFILLGCLFAVAALNTGKWRWWIALAATDFALLYTWPPTLFSVLILNLCVLIRFFTEDRLAPVRSVLFLRWLAASVVAGMIFLQMFLPCVPGLFHYLQSVRDFDGHLFWLKNVGTLFLTGSLWTRSGQAVTPYMEYLPIAEANPVAFYLAMAIALLLFVLGVVRLCAIEPRGRWIVTVLILPGLLTYAYAVLQKKMLMEWYVGFMLQGIAAAVAAGAFWVFSPLRRFRVVRWAGPAFALLILVAFGVLSNPAREFLLTNGAARYRESVLATRPTLDPNAPENPYIITAATTQPPYVYDPRVRRAETIDEYVALMKEADERGVPLYVNNGFPTALKIDFPGIFAMLEDAAVFDRVGYFSGIDVMLDRTVVKYRPDGLRSADVERYRRIETAHQNSRRSRDKG